MGLFSRKAPKKDSPLLHSTQAQSPRSPHTIQSRTDISPRDSFHLPSPHDLAQPQQQDEVHEPEEAARLHNGDEESQDGAPAGLLDESFIGRTITLKKSDDWQQDIIATLDTEVELLYENQRGMFLFGKPFFSGNSLLRSFKFDPPPFQTTNTFLSRDPGTIDPSNPHNAPPYPPNSKKEKWPPDPLKLYVAPFSPHDTLLLLDSRRGGRSFMWKQDRWYVDMRGDVDQEGWEYAFYWNGRWRWCGGNWHGQARFVHSWVRRRKWIRELIRRPSRKRDEPSKEEEQIGKVAGGGLDELLTLMRKTQTPNLRRKVLSQFLDAALPNTLVKLPEYIQRLWMIMDTLTITDLAKHLEAMKSTAISNADLEQSSGLKEAIQQTLEYIYSKPHYYPPTVWPIRSDRLWEVASARKQVRITRRERLRVLRKQWWDTHQSPAVLVRRVRFVPTLGDSVGGAEEDDGDVFYTATEGTISRSGSTDSSKDEWFVAPQDEGEELVRGRSVGGLVREGVRLREEAVVDT